MIAALPGWRVVLIDRESGGSVALPIVAWDISEVKEGYLDCWYLVNEEGVPPQRLGLSDALLGYLAPGDEHEAFWAEMGDAARKRPPGGRMSEKRDSFRIEGVGCWCPGSMTLYQLQMMGHTEECTIARRGWEANYRSMNELERQKAADREAGRQLREAAEAIVASGPSL